MVNKWIWRRDKSDPGIKFIADNGVVIWKNWVTHQYDVLYPNGCCYDNMGHSITEAKRNAELNVKSFGRVIPINKLSYLNENK